MSGYNRHAEEDDQARTLMGLLLHRARMHRGMTRAQVARKSGVPAKRIREIEKGVGRSARLEQLQRISDAIRARMAFDMVPDEVVAPPAPEATDG